ncbi:hypothetical protein [Sphingomonas sp. SUN039]|uniref:hypothetical protein n=1 Tax=Sphingomonas sp. SUN039 TaxID=2937787 RepID=UPI0021644C87|nr:hypothetical protein [Sphingomonas sp. SUN039]UVO55434.1 hypothetical protein M0209_15375 [Sphingomonas sp. SUN039]
MSALLPTHYALSELLLAVAGGFAIVRAGRISTWFAIGLAPVALAGLVGAIRIAAGMTGFIVDLHGFLSRPAALFGLACLVAVLLRRQWWLPPVLGIVAMAIAVFAPAATPLLFIGLTAAGAVLAYRAATDRALLSAVSFAGLLIAILASMPFRSTQPALAWHLFHTLVAVWFVLVAAFVVPILQAQSPTAPASSTPIG